MASPAQLRSWMFVPGNRERFIHKAESSSADAVLLDIEDGVLPGEKAEARIMIAAALARSWSGPRRLRTLPLYWPWSTGSKPSAASRPEACASWRRSRARAG